MLRIVKHIKSLLSEHDCVIIPEFGGFVLQEVAASVEADTHLFIPSHKEIVFNETLQHNDGLLIGSYMKSEECDYPAAKQSVQADVYSLKELLQKEQGAKFEKIGEFTLGKEGQLVFHPGDSEWLNANSYGMHPFSFKPLANPMAEVPTKNVKTEKEVYYIPVSRQFIRIVAAAVVAIVLFLGTSLPVEEINHAAYTASFIPLEMAQPPVWQQDKPARPAESSEESIVRNMKQEPKAETAKTSAPVLSAPKPETKEIKKQETISGKKYHIVIGSFPTQAQADKFMKETGRKECPHMDIVLNQGKYRVYAERFNNRNEAEKYMADLRKNSRYKDAWLFICR